MKREGKRRTKAALKRMYQRDSMGTPHCRPPLPIAARKHHSRSAQAFSIITHSVRIERLGSGWDVRSYIAVVCEAKSP